MKRIFILVGTAILSLILTFMFAEAFSLYHFGDMPTIITSLYLIASFSIFEYILLSIFYIIKKMINKEKLKKKVIIGGISLFLVLILILVFVIVVDADWLNWYTYSSPFYINVIVRSLEFLLPVIVLVAVSIFLLKNK